MLEVSAADLDWERGRWFVRGDPEQGASISEIARAARGSVELPRRRGGRARLRDRL